MELCFPRAGSSCPSQAEQRIVQSWQWGRDLWTLEVLKSMSPNTIWEGLYFWLHTFLWFHVHWMVARVLWSFPSSLWLKLSFSVLVYNEQKPFLKHTQPLLCEYSLLRRTPEEVASMEYASGKKADLYNFTRCCRVRRCLSPNLKVLTLFWDIWVLKHKFYCVAFYGKVI